jgi:Mrp family chromosome partitioning ATPase
MVIIDAPPLLPVTDALVLAPLTDGVVLVVDYGSTRIGEAVQSKTQIDQSGARLLGVVINRIPMGRRVYSDYYHYDDDGSGKRRHLRRNGSSANPDAATPVTLEPSNQ